MTKKKDITGQKFGKLTAIRFTYVRNKKSVWELSCECGNTALATLSDLTAGKTNSCGCLRGENHGKSALPEYKCWSSMRERCHNKNTVSFMDYGARGITVCERWEKFSNFLYDMGLKPSPKHTLDRINVNGNYEPTNCRWVTRLEQAQNKRIYKPNKTGHRDVSWNKKSQRWQARISVNKTRFYLGMYRDLEDAIAARKAAEVKYFCHILSDVT